MTHGKNANKANSNINTYIIEIFLKQDKPI